MGRLSNFFRQHTAICLIIALLVIVVISLLVLVPQFTQHGEKPPLSSLSEDECIEFLISEGVDITDEHASNSARKASIRRLITELEADPNKKYFMSSTDALDFTEEVRKAVKNYLGIIDGP